MPGTCTESGSSSPAGTSCSTSAIATLRRLAHHRREVARGAAEHQVAGRVALPGLHERVVRAKRRLEHVGLAREPAHLLALGHQRAVAGRREEGRDPRAAGAHPLGEGALRVELHLDHAVEEHLLEHLVLADVGRDHLADLAVLEQERDPEVVRPRVVRHHGQALRALLAQRPDQVLRDPAQAEARHHDGGAVRDVAHGLGRALHDLVHGVSPGRARTVDDSGFSPSERPRLAALALTLSPAASACAALPASNCGLGLAPGLAECRELGLRRRSAARSRSSLPPRAARGAP